MMGSPLGLTLTFGAVGAAFAAALWDISARNARRRDVDLGRLPIALIAAAVAIAAGSTAHPTAGVVAIGVLVAGIVDARTGFIFHDLTLATFVALGITAASTGTFVDALAAAMMYGIGLFGLFAAYYLIRRRAGMGISDIRVVACIGMGLGVSYGAVALACAYGICALYAGALIALRRAELADELRFGPFLAGGTVVGAVAQTLSLGVLPG